MPVNREKRRLPATLRESLSWPDFNVTYTRLGACFTDVAKP
jgi:hypothetical protein